jgi:hypothetical protein
VEEGTQPEPSPVEGSWLNGVTAVSARSAWAVGGYLRHSQDKRLILHWNGIRWQQVPSPGTGVLASVTATSPRSAWAAGYSDDRSFRPVMMHWNGTTWKNVPVPPGTSDLYGVAATTARNAWAVGDTRKATTTLTIHWNGSAWK